jgi:hypothetical protein
MSVEEDLLLDWSCFIAATVIRPYSSLLYTVGANETERSAIKTAKSPVKSHKKQLKANIYIILDVGTC